MGVLKNEFIELLKFIQEESNKIGVAFLTFMMVPTIIATVVAFTISIEIAIKVFFSIVLIGLILVAAFLALSFFWIWLSEVLVPKFIDSLKDSE